MLAVLYCRRRCRFVSDKKPFFSKIFIEIFKNFHQNFQKFSSKFSKIFRTKSAGTVLPAPYSRISRHRAPCRLLSSIPELSSRGDFESNLTWFTLGSVSIEFLSFLRPGTTCYMSSTGHNRWRISKALKAVGAGRGCEFRENPYGTGSVKRFSWKISDFGLNWRWAVRFVQTATQSWSFIKQAKQRQWIHTLMGSCGADGDNARKEC